MPICWFMWWHWPYCKSLSYCSWECKGQLSSFLINWLLSHNCRKVYIFQPVEIISLFWRRTSNKKKRTLILDLVTDSEEFMIRDLSKECSTPYSRNLEPSCYIKWDKMSGSSGIRAIRQVRRKKSSLSEVKIAVVGAPGVGKSGKHKGLYKGSKH